MIAMVLAVVLPSLGCLLAGVLGGRAWGRAGVEDAFYEGRAAERKLYLADSYRAGNAADWPSEWWKDIDLGDDPDGDNTPDDDGPLVPLPDRLPDADTLAGMYADLGRPDLPLGPVQATPAGEFERYTVPAGTPIRWPAPEGELIVPPPPTIAELAGDAEYRLCWAELGAARDSAYDWYEREFGTGAFRAVGR